jgi:signal transduction histidine kinase
LWVFFSPAPHLMLESVESRTRGLLIAAFGGVALLLAGTGAGSFALFAQIRGKEALIRARFDQKRADLERIRGGIFLSGALAHDYFAAPSPGLLERIRKLQSETSAAARAYPDLAGEVGVYWRLLEFVPDLAARPRTPGLEAYVRAQLAQRRETMLRIAEGIASAQEREARAAEADVASLERRFRVVLGSGLLLALAAGAGIAAATARRLVRLEADSRALSARLVRAQEEERRSIARELHDDVGQALSGLLLDVGAAARLDSTAEIRPRLGGIAGQAERLVDSVRRIALALRPSMLDDLGLVAALEWQAREVAKRGGFAVEVAAEDEAGELPDPQRTCIYRVAQEALQNCARHSKAARVRVRLERASDGVALRVEDDGAGFRPARERGMGMLGMQERVAQLGGRLRVQSEPGRGTTVTAELPV